MPHLLSAVLLLFVLGSFPRACWQGIDPGAFASRCPVIVTGPIVSVIEAVPGQKRADDLASIRVTAILRNELKDLPLAVGDLLPVRMISRRNLQRTSTDLNYLVRTEATWLVVLSDKNELRIDVHPVQKQPFDGKNRFRFAALRTLTVDRKVGDTEGKNIHGTLTRAQWIGRDREQAGREAKERPVGKPQP